MINLDSVISDSRQLELIELAETSPVTAIKATIAETLIGYAEVPFSFRRRALSDTDLVISTARRLELYELAITGHPACAIRDAMRDAIRGADARSPVPPLNPVAPATPAFALEPDPGELDSPLSA